MLKPDLHCHSHYSDGQHEPEYLVQRALNNGLSHLAITDHDFITNIDGLAETSDELQLICGVEVSCAWQEREVHIVGLFINSSEPELQDLLREQRQRRVARINAMDEKLMALGIRGLTEHVESLQCETWTRSHVAEFLVTNGHCKNWEKAFKKFLSRRGRIHVPVEWMSLQTGVHAINAAGGVAIVAHPGRYGLTKTKTKRLIAEFKSVGGEGIEGSYGNVDPMTRKFLCELALEENLFISVGSDFHSADRHWTDLGKFPTLENTTTKNAIWAHPKWHS